MISISKRYGWLLQVLILTASAFSQGTVIVSWDPNSESDLAGYRLYYGTASRHYDVVIDVQKRVAHQIDGLLTNIRYFFAVTAYDTAGNESDYSDEVSIIIREDSVVTEETEGSLHLVYNFPNPFKLIAQRTKIRYFLQKSDVITLKIYDPENKLVRVLLDRIPKLPGEHVEDSWDGKNDQGDFVAGGIYFCKIEGSKQYQVIKIAVKR